jgi:hypothetical protein
MSVGLREFVWCVDLWWMFHKYAKCPVEEWQGVRKRNDVPL